MACLMVVAVLCLLLSSALVQSSSGVGDLPASKSTDGTGVLWQFRSVAEAPVRLTKYNLPDSVLYSLPQLSQGRPANRSRVLYRPYPPGYKLLFLPALVSLSAHRWYVTFSFGHAESRL